MLLNREKEKIISEKNNQIKVLISIALILSVVSVFMFRVVHSSTRSVELKKIDKLKDEFSSMVTQ